MNVAQIIANQIGNQALYMIGAKNLLDHGDGLSFKTGRVAAGKANYVKITLKADDTYLVEFHKIHGHSVKEINTIDGAYVDMLHELIEANTGLYTSL